MNILCKFGTIYGKITGNTEEACAKKGVAMIDQRNLEALRNRRLNRAGVTNRRKRALQRSGPNIQ